jgi:tetratricopeptide (TPR) repeat protein
LKDELVTQLRALERLGSAVVWHDRKIAPGGKWEKEIADHLESADLILLLISADFIDSLWCYDKEMTRALKRSDAGVRVIPIIIRDCAWESQPFAVLNVLPRHGRPVKERRHRDRAWADMVREIATLATSASVCSPTRISNLPPRNPFFTGRNIQLHEISAALAERGPSVIVQALSGLGGVGKSTLAIEYAHRFAEEYSLIWWVRSEEQATLGSDYAALAGALGLPEKNAPDQSSAIAAVNQWLSNHEGWLLLFDDVQSVVDLVNYVPTARGSVIITTRDSTLGGSAKQIVLGQLAPDEAIQFLLGTTNETDAAAAGELARELGDLPLALEQARAYVEEHAVSLVQYRNLFRARRADLWKHEPDRAKITVATTWTLSIEKLREQNPASAELLNLFAFFAPEEIPRDILSAAKSALPQSLRPLIADELAFNDAIRELRRHSLIEASPDGFSIHRLVQIVVLDAMPKAERDSLLCSAIEVLARELPNAIGDSRIWPRVQRIAPHALQVMAHRDIESLKLGGRFFGHRILNHLGIYYIYRADFSLAEQLLRRAVDIACLLFGEKGEFTAASLFNLGRALLRQEKLEDALVIYERALGLFRNIYGDLHPMVAGVLSELGLTLQALGRYGDAFERTSEAVRIDQQLGAEDADAIVRLGNLGLHLIDRGDFDGGIAYLRHQVELLKPTEGTRFRLVRPLINLAFYDSLRDVTQGARYAEQALSIAESELDPHDPDFNLAILALAIVRVRQGDMEDGQRLLHRYIVAIGQRFQAGRLNDH